MINVYNRFIPKPIRDTIIFYRNQKKWYKLSKTVEDYYNSIPLNDEQKKALRYLRKHHFFLNANKFMYLSNIVSQYEKQ